MASRRSRLKAIANLPVRKKTEVKEELISTFSTPSLNNSDVNKETVHKEVLNPELVKDKPTEDVCTSEIIPEKETACAVKEGNDIDRHSNQQDSALRMNKQKQSVCVPVKKQYKSEDNIDCSSKTNKGDSKVEIKSLTSEILEVEKNIDPVSQIKNKTVPLSSDDTLKENVTAVGSSENERTKGGVSDPKHYSESESLSTIVLKIEQDDIKPNLSPRDRNVLSCIDNESVASSTCAESEKSEERKVLLQRGPSSPVKNVQRPRFIRPSPRVVESSPRRVSVHVSSASESEDDSRRPFFNVPSNRLRKISESSLSGRSQLTPVNTAQKEQHLEVNITDGKPNTSLLRRRRSRINHMGRRLAEARREFNLKHDKSKPIRSALTMFDLIFYNPTSNPMESKKEERKEPLKEELINDSEVLDDPGAGELKTDSIPDDDNTDGDDYSGMPVPQVKIGPNGEIILDEKSLVIETTDAKKGREDLLHSVPVFEDRNSSASYYSRRSKRTRDWTSSETKRFYKALKRIGTDFLLMQTLFPNRSRIELKKKFKREEKVNKFLIDKALNHPAEFDTEELELEMRKELEESEAKQQVEKVKKDVKRHKFSRRTSTFYKESVESEDESNIGKDIVDGPHTGNVTQEKENGSHTKEKINKGDDFDMLFSELGNKTEDVSLSLTDLMCANNKKKIDRRNPSKASIINKTVGKKNMKSSTENANVKFTDKGESAPLSTDKTGPNGATVSGNESFIDDDDNNNKEQSSGRESVDDAAKEAQTVNTVERKTVKLLSNRKRKRKGSVNRMDDSKNKSEKVKKMQQNPELEDSNITNPYVPVITTMPCQGEEFLELLTHNINNMHEATIKLQVTDGGTEGASKNIEVIWEDIPPITYEEIKNKPVTIIADYVGSKLETVDLDNVVAVENYTRIEEYSEKIEEEKQDSLETNSSEKLSYPPNQNSVIVENPVCFPDKLKSKSINAEPPPLKNHGIGYDDHSYVSVIKRNTENTSHTCNKISTDWNYEDEEHINQLKDHSDVPSTAGSERFVFISTEGMENSKQNQIEMFMMTQDESGEGKTKLVPMSAVVPPELIQALNLEIEGNSAHV